MSNHVIRVRAAYVTVALLVVGLAGCASELTATMKGPAAQGAPYVGVFTGEFVEGLPLYRFPTLEIVGSRRALGPDT